MRSGLSRRAVAVGGALLGLTAIVALASRAHGAGGGSTRTVSTDWLLEYLLLRPKDSALFDGETGRHWRAIALDMGEPQSPPWAT